MEMNRRTLAKRKKRVALLKKFFHHEDVSYPAGAFIFAGRYTASEMNSMLNGYGVPSEVCKALSKSEIAGLMIYDELAIKILTRRGFSAFDIAVTRREFRRDLKDIGAFKALREFLTGFQSVKLASYAEFGSLEVKAADLSQPSPNWDAWTMLEKEYILHPDGFHPDDEDDEIGQLKELDTLTEIGEMLVEQEKTQEHKEEKKVEMKIPQGTDPMTAMIAAAVVPVVRDALRAEDDALTEAKVTNMIATEIKSRMPRMIQPPTPPGLDELPLELSHEAFPQVLKSVGCGLNTMLIGPAGSGKTSVAEQIAKILGIPFRFTGAVDSPYKLTGFVDASGKAVRTAFRETYENGGLFLFDEVDASSAGAMMAFNAALANGHADFPDGIVTQHKDFRCIAAANTFGRGSDRIYVGRNALDGATLDRFVVVDFDYDETLERALVGDDMNEWVNHVQAIRKAVFKLKLRFVVSPRASIFGSKLLRAGLSRKMVEEMVIWKGMEAEARRKVRGELS